MLPGLALAALAGAAVVPASAPGIALAAGSRQHADLKAAVSTGHQAHTALKGQKMDPSRHYGGTVPKSGPIAVMLELSQRPAAMAYHDALVRGAAAASSASRSSVASIEGQQETVARAFSASATRAAELYRVHNLYNGIAVRTDVSKLAALEALPGVKAVHVLTPKKLANSHSVPLIGAPSAWANGGFTGAGVTIGIIDTGIDYTHADFAGTGSAGAYSADHAVSDGPTLNVPSGDFPSAKVVGGYDFAGDGYDASSSDPAVATPHADPNPLDCNGHGSHVAGTAAGFGVTSDGSTYTGSYDTSTPFDAMRIGPGVAPQATLYALRVFGCDGSTDLVAEALDWAADPNGDGNFADHLDVVNMSLGGDFASPEDPDSVATDNASVIGITVAAASGNGGDLYDVGGSPGNAPRAIGVAASDDGYDVLDGLQVNSPAAIAGTYAAEQSVAYDWANKPGVTGDLAALPGTLDTTDLSVNNKDGCDPFTPEQAAAVAGKIAFLEWTDDDATRRCGSAGRSANAREAGAIGAVFANDEDTFAAGIVGDDTIPVMITTKTAGDAIRTQLDAATTVNATLSNNNHNSVDVDDPTRVDQVASFSSRGQRHAGNVKPDLTAPGVTTFSVASGSGNQGTTESGTSMATPHVAGSAALVKQAHPDWFPERVKAALMNTAGQDLYTGAGHTGQIYAPNRVGAGRIDVAAAVGTPVVAYVKDDPGAVSVSFGPIAVTDAYTATKTVQVDNTGSSDETYAISYDAITSIPGVEYVLGATSIAVPPGSTRTFGITLKISDPTALTKTMDPTVAPSQGGLPRQFLADASGRILLTPADTGLPTLRVPVYSAPRPASQMSAAPSSIDLAAGSDPQSTPLTLSGTGVDQGSGDTAVTSLISGYELQASSPELPDCSSGPADGCVAFGDEKAADLKYVGAASDVPSYGPADGLGYIAISTWGPWYTPASQTEYDVLFDTNNDGTPDAVLFNTRFSGTDILVTEMIDLRDASYGDVLDAEFLNLAPGNYDTAIFDSDTLMMPFMASALPGVSDGASRVSYTVEAYDESHYSTPLDTVGEDASGPLSFDFDNPGAVVWDGTSTDELFADQPGAALQATIDPAVYRADGGQGVLLVHHHNTDGQRAQVITVNQPPAAAPTISGPSRLKVPYRTTVSIDGTAAPNAAVDVYFHRRGTDGYAKLRSLVADSSGNWHTSFVAIDDHRYYAMSGGQQSNNVLEQIQPTIDGPINRVVTKGSTVTLTGTGTPGTFVELHFHKAGTPADDYSIVRRQPVSDAGRWSKSYLANVDYRVYGVSTANLLQTPTYLIQAR